jgi:4-amino-4-deoxy-L-arabinose transferase-like glycosyltransferase
MTGNSVDAPSPSPRTELPPRRGRFAGTGAYLLVGAVAAVISLWNLGQGLLEEHECYVAIPAANMATPEAWLDPQVNAQPMPPNTAINHWIVPVFNGQPRLVKTPLAYWCLAGLLKLGLPLDEFTARLPSAIEAILLSLVTLALGRKMFGARAGLLGALVLTTSLGVLYWGRNGRPEMLLCLLMAAAMYCFYAAFHCSGWAKHRWLLAGWAAMSMGNLAKEVVPCLLIAPLLLYLAWQESESDAKLQPGSSRRFGIGILAFIHGAIIYSVLLALVSFKQWQSVPHLQVIAGAALVGGPAIWYFFAARGYRRLPPLLPASVPGILLMVAPFALWMWHTQQMFPAADNVWTTQIADRAVGAGQWQKRPLPGYYIGSLLYLALPWVVLIPGAFAVARMKRFRQDSQGLVFLFLWLVTLVMLFNCNAGKHWHYLLPVVPALSLLVGYCLNDLFFEHRWLTQKLARFFVGGHALAAAGGAVALGLAYLAASRDVWHTFMSQQHITPVKILFLFWVALAAAVPLALAVWAYWRNKPSPALGLLFAGVALAMLTFVSGQDLLETNDNLREIAMTAQREVAACHGRLIGWDKPNARIVYYYGQNIPAANAVAKTLRAQYGDEEGLLRWNQWLREPARPVRLVEQLGSRKELQKFRDAGFEPMSITPVPEETARNADDKMSDKFRVPILFKLAASGETTRPAPETPADRE